MEEKIISMYAKGFSGSMSANTWSKVSAEGTPYFNFNIFQNTVLEVSS